MLVDQGDNTLVSNVMTSPVETIPETVNLVMAARILNEKHYHHLAIVNDAGQPVGILTTSDFVRAVAELGVKSRVNLTAGRLSELGELEKRKLT